MSLDLTGAFDCVSQTTGTVALGTTVAGGHRSAPGWVGGRCSALACCPLLYCFCLLLLKMYTVHNMP